MAGDTAVGVFMAAESGLLVTVPLNRRFVGWHQRPAGFAIDETLVAVYRLLDPSEVDRVFIETAAVFLDRMLHLGQPGDRGTMLGLPPLDVVAPLSQPRQPPLVVGFHDASGRGPGCLAD